MIPTAANIQNKIVMGRYAKQKRKNILYRSRRVTCRVSGTGSGDIVSGPVVSGFKVFVTECLSISSSSEAVDDELADEGGVVGRGLDEALLLEVTAGSLTFRV